MATNAGRRDFLQKAGAGLGGLTLAGPLGLFDAARARAEGAPLTVLTADEGTALDALGETLIDELIELTPTLETATALRYMAEQA